MPVTFAFLVAEDLVIAFPFLVAEDLLIGTELKLWADLSIECISIVCFIKCIHFPMGFPGGSVVMQKMQVHSWVGKIPQRRKWQAIPVFLPGESHGQRSLGVGGCSPWGRRVGHDWATKNHQTFHIEPWGVEQGGYVDRAWSKAWFRAVLKDSSYWDCYRDNGVWMHAAGEWASLPLSSRKPGLKSGRSTYYLCNLRQIA